MEEAVQIVITKRAYDTLKIQAFKQNRTLKELASNTIENYFKEA